MWAPGFYHSDQGSNFKGYSDELKRFSKTEIFRNFCQDQGIQWVWTPIGAPHMNGLVERYLGMLKTLMKKAMGNKKNDNKPTGNSGHICTMHI